MTGRRTKLGIATLAVAALALSACASSGGSTAESTTASAAAATSGTSTASAAATSGSAASGSSAATTGSSGAVSAAEWDKIVTAANAEGEVRMYSTMLPEINDRLEQAFELAYPDIDLQITRVVGQEINATLDAERSTNTDGADVVSHVNYDWIFPHAEAGDFVEPVGPDSAGPSWWGTDNLVHNLLQVSVLTGIGIAWRTDLVPDPPKGYEDLLKPEFANGQIGIGSAESPSIADFYAWAEDEFGPGYLEKLAAQQPKVYPTAVPALESLLAGETSIDAWASSVGVAKAKAQGAPVEFILPSPGYAPYNLTYMLKSSKRPNASQVLFNFMASVPGQEAIAQNNISVLPDIPGTIGSPSDVTAANVERILTPGWHDQFYATWADTFGR